MAGFIDIRVSFPVLKGLREQDLIEAAETIIEAGLLRAIGVIVEKWYKHVTRRTGESGAKKNWKLAKLGVMSYAIQNFAVTRPNKTTGRGGGRHYAGFVHAPGNKTPLVGTIVRRAIFNARQEITANLLGLRQTGEIPVGAVPVETEVSMADIALDIILRAFSDNLPGSLAVAAK